MLLQFYIPGPDFRGLARIGKALGDIIDPQRQEREAIRAFLLEHPELGQALGATRREAVRKREEGLSKPTAAQAAKAGKAEERFQVPETNIMEAFGFSPEQEEELLRIFPETPGERISKALSEEGFEELTVEEQLAKLKAAAAGARAEEVGAVSKEIQTRADIAAGLPQLRSALERANAELALGYTQDKINRVHEWIVMNQQLPPGERFRFMQSDFAPEYLRDIQLREQLSFAELEARLRARVDPLERSKDIFAMMERTDNMLAELIDRARIAEENDKDDELRVLIEQISNLARRRMELIPGETFTMLAEEDVTWLGDHRIRFRAFGPATLDEEQRMHFSDMVQRTATDLSEGISRNQAEKELESSQWWQGLTPDEREQFWAHVDRMTSRGDPNAKLTAEQAKTILNALPPDQRKLIEAIGISGRAISEVGSLLGNILGAVPEAITSFSELISFVSSTSKKENE